MERLSRISPKEVIRSARERNNGTLGYAEALLAYYNKKTKYPLRWGTLYSSSSDSDSEDGEETTPTSVMQENDDTQGQIQNDVEDDEPDDEFFIPSVPVAHSL